jgi:hypothetical protein
MTVRQSLRLSLPTLLLLFPFGVATCANAQETEQGSLAFFENNIRPLLVEHCVQCHGPKKSEAGLRLDSLADMLKGVSCLRSFDSVHLWLIRKPVSGTYAELHQRQH